MKHKCNACDSINVSVEIKDYAGDHVPAEIEYLCLTCGNYAYFAYGNYEDDKFLFTVYTSEDK